MIKMTDL